MEQTRTGALQFDFVSKVKMSTFVCEIEIKEQNPPDWCSITHSHSDQPAITVLFHSTSGFFRRYCSAFTLATFWEILFASFASLITSSYTLQHEDQVSSPNLFFGSMADLQITRGSTSRDSPRTFPRKRLVCNHWISLSTLLPPWC